MFNIVDTEGLTIAFDMDTKFSAYGEFGIYVRDGYNIATGITDGIEWWGIQKAYEDLVRIYAECKGQVHMTGPIFTNPQVIFTIDDKGHLKVEFFLSNHYSYTAEITIDGLDQTYLPRFIAFFKEFLKRKPVEAN